MEKEEKKQKYFIITKNKEECIVLELKEFFEDPNKYLQKNTKFIIGGSYLNKHKNSKSLILNKDQNNNLTKLSYIKNNNGFDINTNNNNNHDNNINEVYDKIDSKASTLICFNKKQFPKKRCASAINPKRIMNYNLQNSTKKQSRNFMNLKSNNSLSPLKSIHYEYKTPKEIIDIFSKYNQKEKKNEKAKLFSNKKNDIFNQKYLIQEKNLKFNNKEKNNFYNFSKYLSHKCAKKEENLLLNKIDNYNIKKQIINYLYNNKLLAEKLGNNYWICNLRRSKNNYKINYVNTGRSGKEPWEQIVDAGDMEVEFINNPCIPITIDKIREINNFKYMKKYPNFKSFNKIKIVGQKLFDQEYNNFINNIDIKNKTIKYKLYKDPQEKKIKSIQELTYKENYRPLSRKKQIDNKRKLI